jgi:soluble lytic murein transglycosylase-like protein
MPSTAADVAARRGLADYSRERLLDPAFNIDMGTWYVAEMLRTFGSADDPDWQQSVELAAAAYNGGPGAVRGWLEANGTLPSESARYRQWVGAMWSERAHAASSGFETWMAAGGSRLVEAARGQA